MQQARHAAAILPYPRVVPEQLKGLAEALKPDLPQVDLERLGRDGA